MTQPGKMIAEVMLSWRSVKYWHGEDKEQLFALPYTRIKVQQMKLPGGT